MKHTLLATTALVAMTGAAAAEITISGTAVAVATLALAVTSISRLVQRPHQQTLAVFFR